MANKEIITVKEEPMEFWTFEDESGIFHAVLFPHEYQEYGQLFSESHPLLISGMVEEEYEALSVRVSSVARLESM